MKFSSRSKLLITLSCLLLVQRAVSSDNPDADFSRCTTGRCIDCRLSTSRNGYCAKCYKSTIQGATFDTASCSSGILEPEGCASTSLTKASVPFCSGCDNQAGWFADEGTVDKPLHCRKCELLKEFFDPIGKQCKRRLNVDGQHCNKYAPFKDECMECKADSKLKNGKCIILPENCAEGQSVKICTKCESGFFLSEDLDKCTALFGGKNCLKGNEKTCTECVKGYYPDKAKGCDKLPTGCDKGTPKLCEKCSSGWYRDSATSKCTIFGSKGCDVPLNAKACKSCLAPFYRVDTAASCTALPTGCKTGLSTTICTSCLPGYYLNGSSCRTISNCQTYNAAGCTTCNSGFYLKTQTQCSQVANCATYGPGFTGCTQCNPNFYLASSTECKAAPAGCSIAHVDSDKGCKQCAAGKYLKSATECANMPLNCMTAGVTSTVPCIKCVAGFFKASDGSSCLSFTMASNGNQCIEGTSRTVCTKCNTGYMVTDNGTKCSQFADVKNQNSCVAGFDLNDCSKCLSGFTVESKLCEPITPTNCDIGITGDKSKCAKCKPNFYLASLTSCVAISNCNTISAEINGGCLACNQGYALMTKTTCTLVANCLEFSNTIGSGCTRCKSDYYLDSKTSCAKVANCIVGTPISSEGCKTCAQGYYLKDARTCEKISGCKKSDNTKCLECEAGRYLKGEKECAKIGPNCLVGSVKSNNGCTICKEGFYRTTDIDCGDIIVSNCAESKTKDSCDKCKSGFRLEGGQCKALSSNCAEGSSDSLCSTCKDGYVIAPSASTCKERTSRCVAGKADGSCTKCEKDFFLTSNGDCVQPTEGCVPAKFNGITKNCSQCDYSKGYFNIETTSSGHMICSNTPATEQISTGASLTSIFGMMVVLLATLFVL